MSVGGVDPLREPGRYPLTLHPSTGRADRPAGDITTVTIAGDIMLGRGVAGAHPTTRVRHLGHSPIGWRPVVLRAGGLRIGFVAFNAIGETPRATALG